jgi:hypothetical protein
MGRWAWLVVVPFTALLVTASAVDAQRAPGKEDSAMSEQVARELTRLRLNQAALLAAVNRIIADTAPLALANPADPSAGYVTNGLVLDADGVIVPGRISVAVSDPRLTTRGVRPGDPLWAEPAGSP